MQHLTRLNALIDKAAAIYGNDRRLSIAMGIPNTYVSDWRYGRRSPGIEIQRTLVRLAKEDEGLHIAAAAIEKTGNEQAIQWLRKQLGDGYTWY